MDICFVSKDKDRFKEMAEHMDSDINLILYSDLGLDYPSENAGKKLPDALLAIARDLTQTLQMPVLVEKTLLELKSSKEIAKPTQFTISFGTAFDSPQKNPKSRELYRLTTCLAYADGILSKTFTAQLEGKLKKNARLSDPVEATFVPKGHGDTSIFEMEKSTRSKVRCFDIALRQLIMFLHAKKVKA